MGRVIYIADWLAARGTPPTAPAGAAMPRPKPSFARGEPRGDNGWEECMYCDRAETAICDSCEDGELFTPAEEESALRKVAA
jgi:hypothetical protein